MEYGFIEEVTPVSLPTKENIREAVKELFNIYGIDKFVKDYVLVEYSYSFKTTQNLGWLSEGFFKEEDKEKWERFVAPIDGVMGTLKGCLPQDVSFKNSLNLAEGRHVSQIEWDSKYGFLKYYDDIELVWTLLNVDYYCYEYGGTAEAFDTSIYAAEFIGFLESNKMLSKSNVYEDFDRYSKYYFKGEKKYKNVLTFAGSFKKIVVGCGIQILYNQISFKSLDYKNLSRKDKLLLALLCKNYNYYKDKYVYSYEWRKTYGELTSDDIKWVYEISKFDKVLLGYMYVKKNIPEMLSEYSKDLSKLISLYNLLKGKSSIPYDSYFIRKLIPSSTLYKNIRNKYVINLEDEIELYTSERDSFEANYPLLDCDDYSERYFEWFFLLEEYLSIAEIKELYSKELEVSSVGRFEGLSYKEKK